MDVLDVEIVVLVAMETVIQLVITTVEMDVSANVLQAVQEDVLVPVDIILANMDVGLIAKFLVHKIVQEDAKPYAQKDAQIIVPMHVKKNVLGVAEKLVKHIVEENVLLLVEVIVVLLVEVIVQGNVVLDALAHVEEVVILNVQVVTANVVVVVLVVMEDVRDIVIQVVKMVVLPIALLDVMEQ